MSPIKGLTEIKRLPRLGKIHLGVKAKNPKGVEYPRATDYFVCPDEVKALYGDEPKKLDIIIPVEDDEMWCNQYYRQYSRTRGLVCKGDGETCRRMVDKATGDVANRNSKNIVWLEQSCSGRSCPDYQKKACQEVMNLQFLLPKVPGLGIWQIDTGSINSIRNVNDAATMIRAVCGRVSWIPLTLSIEPTTVVNPDDGKKKTVHCLKIQHGDSLVNLLVASDRPKHELLIEAPTDREAPMDTQTNGVIEGQTQIVKEAEEAPQPETTADEDFDKLAQGDKLEQKSIIDLEWLTESIKTLQTKGLKSWSDANLISYMKKAYQVEGDSVTELASKLDQAKANHFTKKIQETLNMA